MIAPKKVNPVASKPFTYGDWKAGKTDETVPALSEVQQLIDENYLAVLLGDDFLREINETLPKQS